MLRLGLVLVSCLFLSAAVFAAEPTTAEGNNPRTNPDANACYIGGSLYGKCETYDLDHDKDVETWEIAYMYRAGWYIIRFDRGMYARSQVPRLYRWLLGPEPIVIDYGSAPTAALPTTCTVTLTALGQSSAGGVPATITIPLTVINGADPNATVGATPYGFDWLTIRAVPTLGLYGSAAGIVLWDTAGGWSTTEVAATDCPTPTSPI